MDLKRFGAELAPLVKTLQRSRGEAFSGACQAIIRVLQKFSKADTVPRFAYLAGALGAVCGRATALEAIGVVDVIDYVVTNWSDRPAEFITNLLPHIMFCVIAGLGCTVESAQRRFLRTALTLMGAGSAVRPYADGLLHALVGMEADRGTLGPAIREVLEHLDKDVCGGELPALTLRLMRAPGIPAKLWAVQHLAQALAAARQADPTGWGIGSPDALVAAVESALREREPTLTLLTMDLLQLLLPPASIPPGPHAAALCSAVLPLLTAGGGGSGGTAESGVAAGAVAYVRRFAESHFDTVVRLLRELSLQGDIAAALAQYLALLGDADLAAFIVPETFDAWLKALCYASMTPELRQTATRLLSFVRHEYPSVFYSPVLAGIKAASVPAVRHGMTRLALMLHLLPPGVVLPRELVAAALNQTCTLEVDRDEAATLFLSWETAISAFLTAKHAARSVIPSAIKIVLCRLLFAIRKYSQDPAKPQWIMRVVAWATAEPTEVDAASWSQLQAVYGDDDAADRPQPLPQPTHLPSPRADDRLPLAAPQSPGAAPLSPTSTLSPRSAITGAMEAALQAVADSTVVGAFRRRTVEPAMDLRTAATLLIETVSHHLGQMELRALAAVAWRLLLARGNDVLHSAAQLLVLCGEHTPHAVKAVICGDLYATAAQTRARGVHRYDSLWDERGRISAVYKVMFPHTYSTLPFVAASVGRPFSEIIPPALVEAPTIGEVAARPAAGDVPATGTAPARATYSMPVDWPAVLGVGIFPLIDLCHDEYVEVFIDCQHLLQRGLLEEPRLFLRNIFDQLALPDAVRQSELIARLHTLQLYLPVAAPHFASLLLNFLLGVLHYLRVTAPPQLEAVLAAALPLLANLVARVPGFTVQGLERSLAGDLVLPSNPLQPPVVPLTATLAHDVELGRIMLLHSALLAAPSEADLVRELARPAFLQPSPFSDTLPPSHVRAWLALASDLLVLLPGGTATELDAFLHGVGVVAEGMCAHPQVFRSCLSIMVDAARRFGPYFRDEGGFGLTLPHLIRAYQRHRDHALICNAIECAWSAFATAQGEVFVLHSVACLCADVLQQGVPDFRPDPEALWGLVLALGAAPSEDALRVQDGCRTVTSGPRGGFQVPYIIRLIATAVASTPTSRMAARGVEFVRLFLPQLLHVQDEEWIVSMGAMINVYDPQGKKAAINPLSLAVSHRVSLVGLLGAFCVQQQPALVLQHARVLSNALASLLLDPEAPISVPWLSDYMQALARLLDPRACATATALLLAPVQQLCGRPELQERAAHVLRALVALPRLHDTAAETMRGEFASTLLAICARPDAPRPLWTAAASLLATLMSVSAVPVAPPPALSRVSVDEASRLLMALTAVALRLGADAFASPTHASVQWLWLLDAVTPALSREALFEVAARALKALMLRASGCNSSHWIVIASLLVRMMRLPPSTGLRAFLDLLEFIAAARPAVYPLLAPYLSTDLAAMQVGDLDSRQCIERIQQLVVLDAAPPPSAEWLELFEPVEY